MSDRELWMQTLQAVFSAHSELAFDRRTNEEFSNLLRAQQTLQTLVVIEQRKEGLV